MIRTLRLQLNLTQAQLAARLGMGHSTYCRHEGREARGRPMPTWLALAVQQIATQERTEHEQH